MIRRAAYIVALFLIMFSASACDDRITDDNKHYTEDDLDQITNDINVERPYSDQSLMYRNWTSQCVSSVVLTHSISILKALTEGYLPKFQPQIEALEDEGWNFNTDRTKKSYYNYKYPYSRQAANGHWYSMGDFIKTCTGETATTIGYGDEDGWDIDMHARGKHVIKVRNRHMWWTYSDSSYDRASYIRIPERELNNDLNFAEVAVILSQGDMFDTDEQKYKEYKNNLMNEEDHDKYFYEMEAIGPFYYITYNTRIVHPEEDVPDEIIHHNTENEHGETKSKGTCESWVPSGAESVRKYFYYKIKIKPWGLRELYKIAGFGFADDDEQPGDEPCTNQPDLKDYEVLDMHERTDRVYNRMKGSEDYLGPSALEDRGVESPIYGEGKTYKKKGFLIYIENDGSGVNTGRSANWYIKKKDLMNLEDYGREEGGGEDEDDGEEIEEGEEGTPDMSVLEFLEIIKPMVLEDMRNSGILASLTAAQAIIESTHGTSGLARSGKNLFGIKGTYNGQGVWMWTNEYVNGVKIRVKAQFRKYPSWAESISDHSAMFNRMSRYANLRGCTDWKDATRFVKEDGYATSPDYITTLRNTIKTYHLYDWDKEVLGG